MRFIEGDLKAFRNAMNAVAERKEELESAPERLRAFMDWPGTQALLNVLIMVITRCEGLLEDYRQLLDKENAPSNVVLLRPNKGDQNVSTPK